MPCLHMGYHRQMPQQFFHRLLLFSLALDVEYGCLLVSPRNVNHQNTAPLISCSTVELGV